MANRAKRIKLSKVSGAEENQVRWLRASRVRTPDDAKKAASAFMADLEKTKTKKPKAK